MKRFVSLGLIAVGGLAVAVGAAATLRAGRPAPNPSSAPATLSPARADGAPAASSAGTGMSAAAPSQTGTPLAAGNGAGVAATTGFPNSTPAMGAAAGSGITSMPGLNPGAAAVSGINSIPGMGGVAPPAGLPQDYSSAKQQIETAVAAHPKEFGRRMAAAAFYMNANDHRSAVPHLEVATRLTNRVFPWIALGDAATLSGQYPLANRAYDRAMKIDAGNAFAIRGKAQLLMAEQKFGAAEALLLKWLKRYPDNNHIRTQLGTLYLLESKAAKAIKVLEPAVKSHPELAYQHALLGDAYARERHVEKGIAEMQEAVRLDPTIADAWGKIGLYHVNLSRYREAREPLERAISLNPMESQFYAALGDSWVLEEQDEEHFTKGTQLYRQALQLDPRNEKALYSYGMALMRRARKDDLPEAVGLFKKLLEINPNDMNAHYKLSEIYRTLGKTREAKLHKAKFLEFYAKGREQTRRSYQSMSYRDTPEVHLKLGREAMARKEYELAAAEFQFALQRKRTLAEARTGLLEAQRKLGRTAGAETPTP
jgi:tetratricopeptide (TPR) repeat protein